MKCSPSNRAYVDAAGVECVGDVTYYHCTVVLT